MRCIRNKMQQNRPKERLAVLKKKVHKFAVLFSWVEDRFEFVLSQTKCLKKTQISKVIFLCDDLDFNAVIVFCLACKDVFFFMSNINTYSDFLIYPLTRHIYQCTKSHVTNSQLALTVVLHISSKFVLDSILKQKIHPWKYTSLQDSIKEWHSLHYPISVCTSNHSTTGWEATMNDGWMVLFVFFLKHKIFIFLCSIV